MFKTEAGCNSSVVEEVFIVTLRLQAGFLSCIHPQSVLGQLQGVFLAASPNVEKLRAVNVEKPGSGKGTVNTSDVKLSIHMPCEGTVVAPQPVHPGHNLLPVVSPGKLPQSQ